MFAIKYKSNVEIERYKARLVVRGFSQTFGEDYLNKFAPITKLHTVRITLSWDPWKMVSIMYSYNVS